MRGIFAVMTTPIGNLRAELYAELVPMIVSRFAEIAENPIDNCGLLSRPTYSRSAVSRIIKGVSFEVTSTVRGINEKSFFDDEYSPDLIYNRPYLLGMSNSGKQPNGRGTNTGDFFVTLAVAPHLNFHRPLFGELADEQSRRTANLLGELPTDSSCRPTSAVLIQEITIERT